MQYYKSVCEISQQIHEVLFVISKFLYWVTYDQNGWKHKLYLQSIDGKSE